MAKLLERVPIPVKEGADEPAAKVRPDGAAAVACCVVAYASLVAVRVTVTGACSVVPMNVTTLVVIVPAVRCVRLSEISWYGVTRVCWTLATLASSVMASLRR